MITVALDSFDISFLMQRGQEEDAECGEDPPAGMRWGGKGDFELSICTWSP